MIRKSVDFFVEYFFHTALVAALLYANTQLIRGFKIDYSICILIFASVLAVYNYSNLYNTFTQTRKIISGLSVAFILLYIPFSGDVLWHESIKIGLLLLLVGCYVFPQTKLNLRRIGILKIFMLSVAWSLAATIGNSFSNAITQLTFIMNFLFIFAISIPFDLRDINIDVINTIPKKIGQTNSIFLSILAVSLSVIIEYFLTQQPVVCFVLVISTVALLVMSTKAITNKYFLPSIELILLLHFILLYIEY